jgi:hypothetical protein
MNKNVILSSMVILLLQVFKDLKVKEMQQIRNFFLRLSRKYCKKVNCILKKLSTALLKQKHE